MVVLAAQWQKPSGLLFHSYRIPSQIRLYLKPLSSDFNVRMCYILSLISSLGIWDVLNLQHFVLNGNSF